MLALPFGRRGEDHAGQPPHCSIGSALLHRLEHTAAKQILIGTRLPQLGQSSLMSVTATGWWAVVWRDGRLRATGAFPSER